MRPPDLIPLGALCALVVVGALLDPAFLSTANLVDMARQQAELSLLVLAGAILLIGGRVDLSLESTAGLAPALAVSLVVPAAAGGLGTTLPAWLAIPVCLIVGAAAGACNAVLILGFRLPALAVTLGTLIALRGLHAAVSTGDDLTALPRSVSYLGSAHWLGVPASIWLCGLLFLAGILGLRYLRHGRAIYAIGGNADAAHAAGVRTTRILGIVFVTGGALAALAGLLLAGRLGSISATHGQGTIFMVLAAALIGGVSLSGGRGSLFGALCGVLVVGLTGNVLALAGVGDHWLPVAYGGLVLGALMLSRGVVPRRSEA